MYISQGELPMSGWYAYHHKNFEEPSLTSRSDQLVGAFSCHHQSFYSKLLTPKYGVSFTFASLTNGIQQFNLISLCILCFVSFFSDERG